MSTDQPDPIPADDQPHAYVAVKRTHAVSADRPEWKPAASVFAVHETEGIDYYRRHGYALIPIGPDGDTGTRAIVEPRAVATVEERDALPPGTVVLSDSGYAWQRIDHWWQSTDDGGEAPSLPATVLYAPAEVSDGE